MEYHINGEPKDISRYVFCPGSQSRAGKIADHFENRVTVSNDRGIVVYSGTYEGHFMTACGTGMGGAAVGIACEELGHLIADVLDKPHDDSTRVRVKAGVAVLTTKFPVYR